MKKPLFAESVVVSGHNKDKYRLIKLNLDTMNFMA